MYWFLDLLSPQDKAVHWAWEMKGVNMASDRTHEQRPRMQGAKIASYSSRSLSRTGCLQPTKALGGPERGIKYPFRLLDLRPPFWQDPCEWCCRFCPTQGHPAKGAKIHPELQPSNLEGWGICSEEGASFTSDSLKGDSCSFSLPTNKSLANCRSWHVFQIPTKAPLSPCPSSSSSLRHVQHQLSLLMPSLEHVLSLPQTSSLLIRLQSSFSAVGATTHVSI